MTLIFLRNMENSDEFKILVATDIHLGYGENDPLRCRDSIETFEEILQLSQRENVDFILLGGDLFHENKPSQFVMHECVRLLRKYCLSSKPVRFEFLSDPRQNFAHSRFAHPNYRDENLNVGTPIFTINGNHDDFGAGRNLCVLDILHECGLVNFFGKYSSVEQITISPLLLKKNETRLALFGLGAVRDERLHRMFLQDKVKFLTLADKTAACQEWFNMFVLHQNRAKHGQTNYIPEKMLPDFFDLVIWGHEHPCFIDPSPSAENEFFVMQPGSSVATALSEGEAGDKFVAVLKIKHKDFKVDKLKLQTVRQFYFQRLNMAETKIKPNKTDTVQKMETFCRQTVEDLLTQAHKEHSGSSNQPKEPLIRLSVDLWLGFDDIFNVVRFGQQFLGRVANPKDLVIFHRHREQKMRGGAGVDRELIDRVAAKALSSRVEDYVVKYFADVSDDKQMLVLTERGLAESLKHFVDKDEKDAIAALFQHQLARCRHRLKKEEFEKLDEESVEKMLKNIHELRIKKDKSALEEDQKDIDQALEESKKKNSSKIDQNGQNSSLDESGDDDGNLTDLRKNGRATDDEDQDRDLFIVAENGQPTPAKVPKRGRGSRGGGRAASKAAPRASRGRSTRKTAASSNSIMDFFA